MSLSSRLHAIPGLGGHDTRKDCSHCWRWSRWAPTISSIVEFYFWLSMQRRLRCAIVSSLLYRFCMLTIQSAWALFPRDCTTGQLQIDTWRQELVLLWQGDLLLVDTKSLLCPEGQNRDKLCMTILQKMGERQSCFLQMQVWESANAFVVILSFWRFQFFLAKQNIPTRQGQNFVQTTLILNNNYWQAHKHNQYIFTICVVSRLIWKSTQNLTDLHWMHGKNGAEFQ